jgi:stalled ribosome rescue protein Dom34
MTTPRHAALWLDHHEARLFHVDLAGFDVSKIGSPHQHLHRHAKGAAGGHEHPDDQRTFFDQIAKALAGAEAILVVGPSTAKLQLLRHLHEHHRAIEAKVVGVESADHPTDGQLVAHAKRYFKVSDPRVM